MLRKLPSRALIALFGWLNPETHREYKQIRAENRRLRRAVREARRRDQLIGDQEQPNGMRVS